MSNIRFASPEHRDFFLDMMGEARRNDCCTAAGRPAAPSGCAALLSTSGTVIPTRNTVTPTPRRICFAASLRLTLWRA